MNKEALRRNFILLNVGRAYHHADWNWKNICSPFVRIHFVVNGTAKIIRKDGSYQLKKNHLYLTPSYVRHEYECTDILELCYIHIYEDLDKGLSLFDILNFPVEIEACPLDIQLINRLIEINPERELQYYDPDLYDNSVNLSKYMAKQQDSPIALEFETQGIIKQIISHFLVQATYKNEQIEKRILKSLHYIHTNIDKQINIDYLAELSYLTKDHFIRLFKKEINSTPGKYISQKKIEKAQLMLLIKNTAVKDIAYSLGLEPSYFNRLFKKLTGETPKKYKKRSI